MPHTLAAQTGLLIFSAVLALSIWKGGRAERAVAIVMGLQLFGSPLINHRHGPSPEYGILAADCVSLAFYMIVAFATDRRWTLWATAFQLLAVLTHFARILDPTLHRWSYMTTTILWGYGVLIALATGTIQVIIDRRRGRFGQPAPNSQSPLNR